MLEEEENMQIVEFDHIPLDEELKTVKRKIVEIRLNELPSDEEIERIIKINPILYFTFNQLIPENELMILAGITFQVMVKKINFVMDVIPEDQELENLSRIVLHPGTEVELGLVLFNIPAYPQRRKIRSLANKYPIKLYLYLEKLPDYDGRKDLRMAYPMPTTLFLVDYIPDTQEIIEMKRIRPYPMLNIYLEHSPTEEEIRLMKNMEMKFCLYISISSDITEEELSRLGLVSKVFQVIGKGEAMQHIFYSVMNVSMCNTYLTEP